MPTLQSPGHLSRLLRTLAGGAAIALITAALVGDPVFLWFAPLLVPAAIWLQARREWAAAERHIEALIIQSARGRRRTGVIVDPGPRRACTCPRRPSGRTLIVNYRKDIR